MNRLELLFREHAVCDPSNLFFWGFILKSTHRLQTSILFKVLLACALLLSVCAATLFGQDFSVGSAPPRQQSVVGAGPFVSLQGRFSIALPQQQHAYRGLSIPGPAGTATGDSFEWRMKEGSFSALYLDAPQPLDNPKTVKSTFDNIRAEMEKLATESGAKLVSEKTIALNSHPGRELRFEFSAGSMICRVYLVSRRMYQVALMLTSEQKIHEATALKVLDSFKVITEAETATARAAAVEKAQPHLLPQEPVAPRVGTDVADEGLRGRVKTVFQESQDLSGTWSVQTRKPDSMVYYNPLGNMTKLESYDYKGNLRDITVFGFLDGARVSSLKSVPQEYNPPPMVMQVEPGEAKPKSDSRYSYKFTYQYDDKKRLTEKTWIMNNGQLWLRYVYKYSGKEREDLVYSANGSLNQRSLWVLDEQGNEVERTIFEPRDGSVRSKLSYAYEFDPQGNWIKRTTSKWVTRDGRSGYEPQSVNYRTIVYY